MGGNEMECTVPAVVPIHRHRFLEGGQEVSLGFGAIGGYEESDRGRHLSYI